MAEEVDVVGFLRERRGQATLDEVSEALAIPKYGAGSAYALLQSLRSKNLVDRRGENWVLLTPEASISRDAAPVKGVERGELAPGVEQVMRAMAKTLAEAMMGVREPADEWELAVKPMKTEIKKREEERLSKFVLKPDVAPEAKKPLVGLATGTFLDLLFLTPEGEPLNGVPICGQLAITGLPGAGKSVLVEEIAVRVAADGRRVLFATAEDTWKSATPRFDLQSRLKQKADILKLDWDRIRENLFVLDTVMYPELRDWSTFAETYRYVSEREGIELAIVDSVTVLESYRGALKYRVMELARYNQLRGITGLYVNQRSEERWDSYDMAGGIGLAHNLDGTIIVDYGRIYWEDQQVDLGVGRGEFVRIVRVLDCRMCNFERRRIRIDITPQGFIKALEPIPKPQTQSSQRKKP
ncbi:MAG: ATPase domain-containing protein [Candidatus Bathyarchaeia archaeon]